MTDDFYLDDYGCWRHKSGIRLRPSEIIRLRESLPPKRPTLEQIRSALGSASTNMTDRELMAYYDTVSGGDKLA